jgi:cell wall-associated NlpC family hydrolase
MKKEKNYMIRKFIIVFFLFTVSVSTTRLNGLPFEPAAKVNDSAQDAMRTELIKYATTLLGKPYSYACSSPEKGFDCSGFVSYVFKNFNISLPRSSSDYAVIGRELKPDEFKTGDILVFYGYKDKTHIGHVGIICEANGMQSKFIHSSSGMAMGVTISELGSDIYTRRFYKCIDVIGKN